MSAESVIITYNVEIYTYIYIYNIYIYHISMFTIYMYIYMQRWMLIGVTGLIKGH